ncbi:MAG: Bax inhibitor-1/YccA family protein [Pseudomonadota bacterium]
MNDPLANRYTSTQTRSEVATNAGLRKYMLGIYNYMASGVLLTGVVSLLTHMLAVDASSQTGLTALGEAIYLSPLRYVLMFAPLAFVLVLSFGIQKLSQSMTQAMFWLFAAVMGVSISWIFLAYTGASVARVFFITSAMFGALSLWGYSTKRDLSGMGTFLFMGVIGLLIASIVNMFLGSSALQWAISVLGVGIFAGLTAYDTQRLRNMYFQLEGTSFMGKAMIMGALSLYLDFINMFMFLLQLLGSRE